LFTLGLLNDLWEFWRFFFTFFFDFSLIF
jgi:hypothetical protein